MSQGNWIKLVIAIVICLYFVGCRTAPTVPQIPPGEMSVPSAPAKDLNQTLTERLRMGRQPSDLGFDEKQFDPCSFGVDEKSACTPQYFAVVHFQLLCRDTEGTVSNVPTAIQPIETNELHWSVNGETGTTQTDENGYGQVALVSPTSSQDQRLTLSIGAQHIGVTASEVSKILLPNNYCHRR